MIGALALLSACAEDPPKSKRIDDRFRALATFSVTLEESILNGDAASLIELFLPGVAASIDVPGDLSAADRQRLQREALLQKWGAILELNRSVELQAAPLERVETAGDRIVVPFFRRYAGGDAHAAALRLVWADGRFGLDRAGEQQLVELLEPTESEAREIALTEGLLADVQELLARFQERKPGATPAGWSELLPAGTAVPRDAWGQELILRVANGQLSVFSVGPDGEPATIDDLSAR